MARKLAGHSTHFLSSQATIWLPKSLMTSPRAMVLAYQLLNFSGLSWP